jgi:hypothetical protein
VDVTLLQDRSKGPLIIKLLVVVNKEVLRGKSVFWILLDKNFFIFLDTVGRIKLFLEQVKI